MKKQIRVVALALTVFLATPQLLWASRGEDRRRGGDDDRRQERPEDNSDDDADDDSDDDAIGVPRIHVRGALTAANSTAFTIGAQVFILTGSTRLSGVNDEVLTAADFAVGQFVHAQGVQDNALNGIRALEIEVEDERGDDDSVSPNPGEDDDDRRERRRHRRGEQLVAQCELPSTTAMRSALEKIIKSTLAADATVGAVKVKVTYRSKPRAEKIRALAAIQGVTVTSGASGVTLAGEYLPESCSGEAVVRVEVTQNGSRLATSSVITVTGRLVERGLRESRR